MTDCNLEPIRFPSCKGRLVEASFSGGAVLAGASTLCRFEQGMGREDAVRLHEALLESFIASFPCPPRVWCWTSMPPTIRCMACGKAVFFMGTKAVIVFLPLHVFCEDRLLAAWLRPGNSDGVRHAWAILALLAKRLRQVWRSSSAAIVLADAGYCNEADLAALENRGVDGHVVLGREGKRQVEADAEKHPAKARMAAKLATEAGRVQYAQRKWRAEVPIGWIKETLGFRRFGLHGLEQIRGEWDLVCLALNVKRMRGLRAA